MRQTVARFGFALALLVLPMVKASAVMVEIQLNPGNIKQQKVAFQITGEERDSMAQVGVTVTSKTEKLSPGLFARLRLSDGKTEFAMVPLEEKREGDKVTYWFHVAPNLLAKSRFEFELLNSVKVKESGKTRTVVMPGGINYWFYVGDFVTPKHVAVEGKNETRHPAKTHG